MKLWCRVPRLAALSGMLALIAPVVATAARAQERTDYHDEMNNVLGAIGFGSERAPIDYAPRPPIVVPPSSNLPPPVDSITRRPAGFPEDPDVAARREALTDPRRPLPPGASAGSRAYLIEPPAEYLDATTVAATGHNVDHGDPVAQPKSKPWMKHRNRNADQ